MLQKDSFQWSVDAEKAFIVLKAAMASTFMFALPNFSRTFVVDCDASGTKIGAALMQEDRSVTSKALLGNNFALSTYEKQEVCDHTCSD